MTVRFNEKDIFGCYLCNKKEKYNQEEVFESVTIYEVGGLGGTYTFFVCPECRKKALTDKVSDEFRKRYKMADGTPWTEVEEGEQ